MPSCSLRFGLVNRSTTHNSVTQSIMGASQSLPERLQKAVAANNVEEAQALIEQLSSSGTQNLAAAVNTKDKNGRTPLIIACARNYHHMAALLLRNGADVHYINPFADSGTALHEAAFNRHENICELLLSEGANPFLANAQGKLPIEQAVLANSINIVRAFDRYASFAGVVDVKTTALAGFSVQYKPRWVVVIPVYPYPKTRGMDPIRSQLWIYKNKETVTPKCRVWLDGATAFTTGVLGTEGVVRLHSSHVEPTGNLYTKYDRGYCLFFKLCNATAAAKASFDQLIQLCSTGGVPATPVPHVQPVPPAVPYGGYPVIPAAAPASAATVTGPGPGSNRTMEAAPDWEDELQALPGESDEEFAARLAAWSLARDAGGDRPSTTPTDSHRPSRAAASTQDQAASRSSGGGNLRGGAAAKRGLNDLAAAAVAGLVDAMAFATVGPAASRPACANPSSGPHYHAASTPLPPPPAPPAGPAASAPSLYPPIPTIGNLSFGRSHSAGHDAAATAATASSVAPPDDHTCVICLSAESECGFLHGSTVHKCVCQECSKIVKVGDPCPLCRQKVERVLGVF